MRRTSFRKIHDLLQIKFLVWTVIVNNLNTKAKKFNLDSIEFKRCIKDQSVKNRVVETSLKSSHFYLWIVFVGLKIKKN